MINLTLINAKKNAVKEKHEKLDFLGILGLLSEQEILLKSLEEIEIEINCKLKDFSTDNFVSKSDKSNDQKPVIHIEE